MRRRPSKTCTVLLALAGLAPATGAAGQQDAPEVGGAAFLLTPVGARATALGQAAMADGGSSEAVFWNPAGLAVLLRSEFAVHYAHTFVSNNSALTLHFVDQRLGTVGVSAYLVDYGSQPVVPPTGDPTPTGRFSPKNVQLLATYATDVTRRVGLGVSYKLIQFRQDCQGDCGPRGSVSGTTHGVDLGAQLALGHADVLRIGIAVRHAGFKLQIENRAQADPLPTQLALGVAYRLPLPQGSADLPLGARVLLDLQDDWGEYGSPDARIGLELGYGELLHVRAGYAFLEGETRGASVGFGVRYERIAVDFARIFYDSGNFDEPVHLSLRVLL